MAVSQFVSLRMQASSSTICIQVKNRRSRLGGGAVSIHAGRSQFDEGLIIGPGSAIKFLRQGSQQSQHV